MIFCHPWHCHASMDTVPVFFCFHRFVQLQKSVVRRHELHQLWSGATTWRSSPKARARRAARAVRKNLEKPVVFGCFGNHFWVFLSFQPLFGRVIQLSS